MRIQVVLFDLGSTLVYDRDPWPPIFEQAGKALFDVLKRAGIETDEEYFFKTHSNLADYYYGDDLEDIYEQTAFRALKDLLAGKGHTQVPDEVLRAALDAHYAITQQNWHLETDALPVLAELRARGYRLGLISNTSDDKNVQQIIDQHGLRPYFEFIITSAAIGMRKPDGQIFQRALTHFGILPAAGAMVGDRLDADVLGANRLGIYSIWITRRAVFPSDGELMIQPQAVISSLSDLPALLESLE